MHPSQIVFLVLVLLVIVRGFMTKPRQTIGGLIGGVLGIGIPAAIAEIYVLRGGDPTAAGALSFVCILTVPLGIALGILIGNWTSKSSGTETSNKDKV